MLSNRASAQRSRLRRQERLDQLEVLVSFALLRPLDFHYRELVHLLAGFFICCQVVPPVSLFMQQVLWEEIISSSRVNTMCPLDIVVSFFYWDFTLTDSVMYFIILREGLRI
jgi:hypothetical protein